MFFWNPTRARKTKLKLPKGFFLLRDGMSLEMFFFFFLVVIENLLYGIKQPRVSCNVVDQPFGILCRHLSRLTSWYGGLKIVRVRESDIPEI